MKRIYLFTIGVMLLVTSCGHKKEGDATLIRPVKTASASSQSVIRKDFSGIVEAVEYVKLAFRVSGQVINLPVVEGQRVKKGQLIAAIDPRDISLQYAADKAAYETAAAQVERTSACWDARLSPCRNMKSALPITKRQSPLMNCPAIICGIPN